MADVVVGRDKCGEQRIVSLPLSRIRVIMKSSPEVSSINQEALMLTAKATELFVQYLAAYSYRHGSGKGEKALTYNDLSNTAEQSETFQFLAAGGHPEERESNVVVLRTLFRTLFRRSVLQELGHL
ncbi:chromatin accessibility complex protein 1 isoform X2 [Sturnira hondurensis]|uniref:chromatin accessibility complex protein 1 isoform X2 n=1 Tax=Sturnira hondurensis TaxID=192404 RepID=UPI00187A9469|nr:chromatin accessibility complex protein 1 isoform X2 [Sturnira hondurensis]